ncbi:MAG: hypothetical protein PHU51_01530 [Candidatus Nanoarchaeia archaeon]|nr:hypothetical protein [Candidatus Nanoarchaeia archaeon]
MGFTDKDWQMVEDLKQDMLKKYNCSTMDECIAKLEKMLKNKQENPKIENSPPVENNDNFYKIQPTEMSITIEFKGLRPWKGTLSQK